MKDEIIRLKMPERVRLRPNVVFGHNDIRGSIETVKMLLNIFFTEAIMGFCKRIDVRILKDNSIEIISHDRGFLIDETVIDGKPAWYYIFCEIFAGPKYAEKYRLYLERRHSELYGSADEGPLTYGVDEDATFALCCIQSASEFMTVEAVRDGVKKSLHFKCGYSVGDIEKTDTTEPASTKIHFKPDSAVFKDVKIPTSAIADILRDAAVTIPGLNCTFEDERIGLKDAYCFENGIVDYACDIAGNCTRTPFFVKEIEVNGKDRYDQLSYDARVKVALAFSDSVSHISCFHNYHTLKLGGDHLKAAEEKILKVIRWRFNEDEKIFDISLDKVKEKLILVIETNCSRCSTRWRTAQKTYITNAMIRDMCSDLFENDFKYYIKVNKDLIRSFFME